MIKKKTIAGICVVLMLLSIGGSQAMIDLTGTQTGTGGGGFSGKYTDLNFAGTTGLSDAIDNESVGGNPFNQDLNTTDDVKFDGIAMGCIINPQARIHIDSDGISTPLNSNGIMIASDGNDVFYETFSADSTEGLVMHGDGSCMSGIVHNEYGFHRFEDYENEALILFTQCQKPIIFKTNNITRMTIDENGNIIFNNTLTLDNMTISNWTDISSSGGNPFNQSLNTTDNVTFGNITLGNSDGDHYIYFYNDGSNSSEAIFWMEAADEFYITDRTVIGGSLQASMLVSTGMILGYQDICTQGTGDDFWLGTVNQANSLFRAYANGTLICENISVNNTLNVSGTLNVTGGYKTDVGTGWTGWIDDGANVNCTYSGGILIAVSATSGSVGYNETG